LQTRKVMAQSFTSYLEQQLASIESNHKHRVLVTGGGGRIGSYFAEHSANKFEITLLDRSVEKMREKGLEDYAKLVEGDISNLDFLKNEFAKVDSILHLAGDPNPSATWDSIHETNIVGTYNTYVAAKAAQCKRVVFASSIHAISGYPADVQVKTSEPVNPGDLYGVSKCFGEAMGRYMATQEGLSVIAIRIGAFQPLETAKDPTKLSMLDAFVSERDLNQLLELSIEAQNINFAIFQGLSDNRFKRMDISDARELVGYSPQDSFTKLNPALKDLELDETVANHSLTDGQKSGIRNEL
jgi:NAD(P)-dependent dehydrogenase (short-subunit alcohol dehydrogenase family)